MAEEGNKSLNFILTKIDETRNYFIEQIKNNLMTKKHEKRLYNFEIQ